MLSKASTRGRRSRGCRQSKGSGEIPPSIASLPSLPDPREQQLEQIIRNLPLKKGGEDNSAADARVLFEVYTLASVARVQQKKLVGRGPDYGSTRSQANCWQIVNSAQAAQGSGSKHI